MFVRKPFQIASTVVLEPAADLKPSFCFHQNLMTCLNVSFRLVETIATSCLDLIRPCVCTSLDELSKMR